MVPAMKSCSENILREWKEMISGSGKSYCDFDVYPYMEVFTSSVLARLMFNSTYTDEIKRTFLKLSELEKLGKLAVNTFSVPGQK